MYDKLDGAWVFCGCTTWNLYPLSCSLILIYNDTLCVHIMIRYVTTTPAPSQPPLQSVLAGVWFLGAVLLSSTQPVPYRLCWTEQHSPKKSNASENRLRRGVPNRCDATPITAGWCLELAMLRGSHNSRLVLQAGCDELHHSRFQRLGAHRLWNRLWWPYHSQFQRPLRAPCSEPAIITLYSRFAKNWL